MPRSVLYTTSAVLLVSLSVLNAFAQERPSVETIAGSGYGIVGASLARAEEAVCRSIVNYTAVKGAFGEAVMDRVVLGSRRGGGWQTISVSPKPQGIDGLYIKRDGLGNPHGLLVGEAKFGLSRLAMTKDGRQLSSSWTSSRLSYEAARYQQAGSIESVKLRARPSGLAKKLDVVEVRLSDSRSGYFWRSGKFEPWAYDGPQGSLENAQKNAIRDGRYLQGASEGRISYRQRAYMIDVTRDTISVKIHDAKQASSANIALKEIARIKIDAATRTSYLAETKVEIARQLMVKNPHLTEGNAKAIAESATRKMKHLEAVIRQPNQAYWSSVLADSGKAGAVSGILAGSLDMAVQLCSTGQIDWGRTGGMTLLGAGAAGAGSIVQHMIVGSAINNAVSHQFFVQTANALGLPTGMSAANIIGQGAGGIVGSGVFVLGMWLSGNMNDRDAARAFSAGAASSVAGAAAGAGVVALATAYGTAGTGAAISGLAGASANSAALAWLGGGTVAAGGGGTALGTAVVGGVVVVVAVAVGAVIYWGYAEYDDIQTNYRYQYTADNLLSNGDVLKELSRRQWFPRVPLSPAGRSL